MSSGAEYEKGLIRTDRGLFIDKGNQVFDPSHPDFGNGGARGNGTTDDILAIQDAIDFAYAAGGGIVSSGKGLTFLVTGTITVKDKVHLDLSGSTMKSNTDVDTIIVLDTGGISNMIVDVSGVTIFSNVVVTYKASAALQRILRPSSRPWAASILVKGKTGARNGTAFKIHAEHNGGGDGAVQFARAEFLSAQYFEKGIHLFATDASGGTPWVNGCHFSSCVMYLVQDPVYEECVGGAAVAGNFYLDFDGQWGPGDNNGQFDSYATFIGHVWDGGVITFVGSDNRVITPKSVLFDVIDSGINNRVIARDGEYYDGRGQTAYGDRRNSVGAAAGWREFIDFFDSATVPGESWRATNTGATTSHVKNQRGSTGFEWLESGLNVSLANTVSNFYQLDWNARTSIWAEHLPRLLATFRTDVSATGKQYFAIGLWSSSSDYILFIVDPTAYGDTNIRVVCRAGSTSTTVDTGIAAVWSRIYFLSIVVHSITEVQFKIGWRSFSSSNLQQGIFSQRVAGQFSDDTITTNIPSLTFIEPYWRIENQDNVLTEGILLDLQCRWRTRNV